MISLVQTRVTTSNLRIITWKLSGCEEDCWQLLCLSPWPRTVPHPPFVLAPSGGNLRTFIHRSPRCVIGLQCVCSWPDAEAMFPSVVRCKSQEEDAEEMQAGESRKNYVCKWIFFFFSLNACFSFWSNQIYLNPPAISSSMQQHISFLISSPSQLLHREERSGKSRTARDRVSFSKLWHFSNCPLTLNIWSHQEEGNPVNGSPCLPGQHQENSPP